MAKENKKKKKKFKIKWTKIFVWLALIVMVLSCVAAIISPILYS